MNIADDGPLVNSYFDTALPNDSPIEFGYDNQVLLRFPDAYYSQHVVRLDNTRLPKHLHYQDNLLG
ncbi:MAG: hypothetical protein IPP22_08130 [Nitrosomonas sp.]|nr:hypothetical protein [Nitrosomonas sp.]